LKNIDLIELGLNLSSDIEEKLRSLCIESEERRKWDPCESNK